jgi:hypothetical protein
MRGLSARVMSVMAMLRQRLKSASPNWTTLTARDDSFSIPLTFVQLQKPARESSDL